MHKQIGIIPVRPDEIRRIKAWLTERKRLNPDTGAFYQSGKV